MPGIVNTEMYGLGVEAAFLADKSYDRLIEARDILASFVKLWKSRVVGIDNTADAFEEAQGEFAAALREFRDYDAIVGMTIGRIVSERSGPTILLNPVEEDKDYAHSVAGLDSLSSDLFEVSYQQEFGTETALR